MDEIADVRVGIESLENEGHLTASALAMGFGGVENM
jgi:hypothetical protein